MSEKQLDTDIFLSKKVFGSLFEIESLHCGIFTFEYLIKTVFVIFFLKLKFKKLI